MAESPDLSNAIEQLQQMLSSDDGQSQIQNILNMFTSDSSDSSVNADTSSPNRDDGLDLDTIMKISSVMQAMNSQGDNSKTMFLKSLRPFLKESRQNKLDQATKLMKIASVLKIFRKDTKGGV